MKCKYLLVLSLSCMSLVSQSALAFWGHSDLAEVPSAPSLVQLIAQNTGVISFQQYSMFDQQHCASVELIAHGDNGVRVCVNQPFKQCMNFKAPARSFTTDPKRNAPLRQTFEWAMGGHEVQDVQGETNVQPVIEMSYLKMRFVDQKLAEIELSGERYMKPTGFIDSFSSEVPEQRGGRFSLDMTCSN